MEIEGLIVIKFRYKYIIIHNKYDSYPNYPGIGSYLVKYINENLYNIKTIQNNKDLRIYQAFVINLIKYIYDNKYDTYPIYQIIDNYYNKLLYNRINELIYFTKYEPYIKKSGWIYIIDIDNNKFIIKGGIPNRLCLTLNNILNNYIILLQYETNDDELYNKWLLNNLYFNSGIKIKNFILKKYKYIYN